MVDLLQVELQLQRGLVSIDLGQRDGAQAVLGDLLDLHPARGALAGQRGDLGLHGLVLFAVLAVLLGHQCGLLVQQRTAGVEIVFVGLLLGVHDGELGLKLVFHDLKAQRGHLLAHGDLLGAAGLGQGQLGLPVGALIGLAQLGKPALSLRGFLQLELAFFKLGFPQAEDVFFGGLGFAEIDQCAPIAFFNCGRHGQGLAKVGLHALIGFFVFARLLIAGCADGFEAGQVETDQRHCHGGDGPERVAHVFERKPHGARRKADALEHQAKRFAHRRALFAHELADARQRW